MTAQAPTTSPRPGSPAGEARSPRPFWIAIGVLVLLLIAMYVWKVVSVDRVEERFAEARTAWEEGARHAVRENTRTLLALTAVPLGLAAREEAMAQNWGVMQDRFERLVREPGVERVLYATAGDSITVSTDRSLVGQSLASAIPGQYARPISTNVIVEGGAYQAIVPITGLNERLGVVVLTYRPPSTEAPVEAAPADTAPAAEPGA